MQEQGATTGGYMSGFHQKGGTYEEAASREAFTESRLSGSPTTIMQRNTWKQSMSHVLGRTSNRAVHWTKCKISRSQLQETDSG